MSRPEGPVRAPGEKVAEGVRRRAVLRAGAWAVPAVTVVAAAPAHAASVPAAAPQVSVWVVGSEAWSLYARVVLAAPLAAGASLLMTDQGRRLALSGVIAAPGWTGAWPDNNDIHRYAFTSSAPSAAGTLEFVFGRSWVQGGIGPFTWPTATLFDATGTPLATAPPATVLP